MDMYYTYLMIRIQLHIDEEQNRLLRTLAGQTGATRAELIRRAIDLLLRSDTGDSDPLLDLIGSAGPAGRSDVAGRHDEVLYVAESGPADAYGDDHEP